MITTVYTLKKKRGCPSDYDELLFALKARGTHDTRYSLGFVHIEDGKAICTNGHFLFAVSLAGTYENGDYRPIKQGTEIVLIKEDAVNFPAWKQVIPSKEGENSVKIELVCKTAETFLTELIGQLYKHNVHVNSAFLRLLTERGSYTIFCQPPTESEYCPVLIEQGSRQMVFMPYRLQ